jgi:Flp pilus assembly protein TadG
MNTPICRVIHFNRSDHGSAIVEFALVAPLMIWFMFTVIYFAMYLGIAHSVQQLAADAARVSIAGIDSTEQTQLSAGFIQRNASSYLFIDGSKIALAAGPAQTDPTTFDVTVRYDARDLLAWYPVAFAPFLGPVIERTAAVPTGGW